MKTQDFSRNAFLALLITFGLFLNACKKEPAQAPGGTALSEAATAGDRLDTWTQKADFGGLGRQWPVGFSIGSKGYIGTGCTNNPAWEGSRDIWEYDPRTNCWSQKADFGGVGRCFAVGFSIGNKGYIGTGQIDGAEGACDFWEYDPKLNLWTVKAEFPGAPRDGAVGFSIGNKGYIGTGLYRGRSALKDFWEYNPTTNRWIRKADLGGAARSVAVGFNIGNKGYIGIGDNPFTEPFNKKDFWEYDPATDRWTRKADFPGRPRSAGIGLSIGDKGFIGSGFDDSPIGDGRAHDFWEYDPVTDSWKRRADLTTTGLVVSFSIGNHGYAGISSGAGPNKEFWQYTPSDTTSSSSAEK